MKPQISDLNHRPVDNSQLIVLKVMLVYDDTEAGLRAKLALEYLPKELKPAEGYHIRFWRQDLLSLPWLREQAALEACDADVILISIDEQAETPGEIKDWLTRWMQHKGSDPCALGVLTASNSLDTENSTINYIKCVADSADAIFFSGTEPSNRFVTDAWPAFDYQPARVENLPFTMQEMEAPISR